MLCVCVCVVCVLCACGMCVSCVCAMCVVCVCVLLWCVHVWVCICVCVGVSLLLGEKGLFLELLQDGALDKDTGKLLFLRR